MLGAVAVERAFGRVQAILDNCRVNILCDSSTGQRRDNQKKTYRRESEEEP